MKKVVFTSFLVLIVISTKAQITAVYQHTGISYATMSGVSVPSLSYQETLAFGKSRILRMGTGLQLSLVTARDQSFKNNDRVLTIVDKARTTVLSIPVHFEIHVNRVFIGANADLIGIAFGKKLNLDSTATNFGKLDSLTARPVGFSSIIGTKGTTNTQLYVGIKVSPEFSVRFGVNIVNSQYTTNYFEPKQKGYVDFDKFRFQSQAMPFISLVFTSEK